MSKSFSIKKIASITFGLEIALIAIAVGRAIILQRSPMRYFGEGGFITWLSILQLLFIAYLCWKISQIKKNKNSKLGFSPSRKPEIFWRIAAIGMFFFALDEYFQIHENLDKIILNFLNIEINSFTGRLDDFIILFYAVLGLLIIYFSRQELKTYRNSVSWFSLGLFFCFLTILFDMISHNRATFSIFANNLEQLNQIHHWMGAVEEIPKILAEGAFILTLYQCMQTAQKIKRQQAQSRKYFLGSPLNHK